MRIIVRFPASDARDVTTEVDVPWSACTEPLGFPVDFVLDPACTAMQHTVVEGESPTRMWRTRSFVIVYGDCDKGVIKLQTWSDDVGCIISAPSLGPDLGPQACGTLIVYDAVASGIIPAFGMEPCTVMQRVRLTWKLLGRDGPAYDLGLSQLSPVPFEWRELELRNGLRICRYLEPHVVELQTADMVRVRAAVCQSPSPHGWVVLKTSAEHCICVELWRPWEDIFEAEPFGIAREMDAVQDIVVLDMSTVTTTTMNISADVARAFVWRWACCKTWDAAVELKQTFAEMADWMGMLLGDEWWWN